MMNMPLTVFMISDLAGWTQTEVVGMWGWKRVHPDDIRRIKRNIPLPANAIYRVYKKNGEYVTVNCQYNRIGSVTCLVVDLNVTCGLHDIQGLLLLLGDKCRALIPGRQHWQSS
eukprot:1395309-Amorphochlora_amoeboformis.AAC.1